MSCSVQYTAQCKPPALPRCWVYARVESLVVCCGTQCTVVRQSCSNEYFWQVRDDHHFPINQWLYWTQARMVDEAKDGQCWAGTGDGCSGLCCLHLRIWWAVSSYYWPREEQNHNHLRQRLCWTLGSRVLPPLRFGPPSAHLVQQGNLSSDLQSKEVQRSTQSLI